MSGSEPGHRGFRCLDKGGITSSVTALQVVLRV